jgi:hypothetical protein
MRLLLPELSDADMSDVAAILTERGYPGGIQALAAEARDWIAECEWADLGEEDVEDLTDAQALSGAGRKFVGGLEEFISLGGYPPGHPGL